MQHDVVFQARDESKKNLILTSKTKCLRVGINRIINFSSEGYN